MPDADTGKAVGGWDPAWDVFQPPVPRPLRPQKLHKNQRDRAQRADKVNLLESTLTHGALVPVNTRVVTVMWLFELKEQTKDSLAL